MIIRSDITVPSGIAGSGGGSMAVEHLNSREGDVEFIFRKLVPDTPGSEEAELTASEAGCNDWSHPLQVTPSGRGVDAGAEWKSVDEKLRRDGSRPSEADDPKSAPSVVFTWGEYL